METRHLAQPPPPAGVPAAALRHANEEFERNLAKIQQNAEDLVKEKDAIIAKLQARVAELTELATEKENAFMRNLELQGRDTEDFGLILARVREEERQAAQNRLEEIAIQNEEAEEIAKQECKQKLEEVREWAQRQIAKVGTDKDKEIDQLKETLKDAQQERASAMQAATIPLQDESVQLREHLARVAQENTDYKAQMTRLEMEHRTELMKRRTELQRCETEKDELKFSIKTSKERLGLLRETIDERIGQTLARSAYTGATRPPMLAGLREHIARLRQVVEEVQVRSREELMEAGQQVTALAGRCETTEADCARISDTIAATQRRISAVKEETGEVSDTIRTLTMQQRTLTLTHARLVQENQRLSRILEAKPNPSETLVGRLFGSSATSRSGLGSMSVGSGSSWVRQ